jgi:NarL family two-component system response regulator LiaR
MLNIATTLQQYPTQEKLSVLVVDDHRYFRESLISYLSDVLLVSIAGSAGNGVEAVAMVEKLRPLLVIMDIQMPEMDGVTACRLLKASHPDLRVILYSMNTPDNYENESLGRADSFVPKDRLFDELRGLLNHI